MHPIHRRATLLAALGSIAALGVAGTAHANVAPPIVDGNTLTVNSDDAADAITLSVAGGFIAVNGTATTLAANDNAQITVNGNGGGDTIDASALAANNYGALAVDAGAGDDSVTGGADADDLTGGLGEDRLVGFRGTDDVFGGEGDDLMIWNNGDGTDRNDGDAGFDEAEINGSPTAGDLLEFGVNPDEAGRVLVERLNLIGFEVNLVAERVTVNGLGGSDVLQASAAQEGVAGLTAFTLNGNTSADVIAAPEGADRVNGGGGTDLVAGGAGADVVSGGDANDSVIGAQGDDRIAGDRGADEHDAGEGDDVIVWNNGDGSDPVNEGGDGFDTVEVNGSATAGDVMTLVSDGGVTTFDRLNLVPFTLGIANDNEAVEVNGLGGADSFTVLPGVGGPAVVATGGPGGDELVGADEPDSFFGGSGNDAIAPGLGADLADGDEGEDNLLTRDGQGDLVRGGAGIDRATTDEVTVDAVDGVEQLDATAPPAPPRPADLTALVPTLGKVEVVRQKRALVARAVLTCPAAEAGGCRTTATLATAKRVRVGKVRAVLVLGSKRVALDPGERADVGIRLSTAAAELARRNRIATRLTLESKDAAGNSATRSTKVELHIPRG